MKQILILSGKGGTGKTVITGSFAAIAKNKVMVDCDVDAADLHLLLQPTVKERHEFKSGQTAVINSKFCHRCGRCLEVCRFKAITTSLIVEPFSCEGCKLCSYICPNNAITMKENIAGEWFVSDTKYGSFVHAKLGVAEENSGKLVAKIRQVATDLARQQQSDYVIIDGPPGIGCPVIASLSGVDVALIITEPTLSGLHDAKRVIELANHFKIPVKMVINKYDLNPHMSNQIEVFCIQHKVPMIGKIPFDKAIVESMVKGIPIVEHVSGTVKEELFKIWDEIKKF